MKILAPISACITLIIATGCSTVRLSQETCAMVLLIDGRHMLPSRSQFEAIERKLRPQFAAKKLFLVPHPSGADLIATIECVAHAESSELTNLVVRDIGPNSFVSRRAIQSIPADMPSLREAEREHQKSLMGR